MAASRPKRFSLRKRTVKKSVEESVEIEYKQVGAEETREEETREEETREEETKEEETKKKKKKKKKKRKRYAMITSGGYKRVLNKAHPGMRVSAQAMTVLEGMMRDMFEGIAEEAARLSKYCGKATLSSREIQSAVMLLLPSDLARNAVAAGVRAVSACMKK